MSPTSGATRAFASSILLASRSAEREDLRDATTTEMLVPVGKIVYRPSHPTGAGIQKLTTASK